MLTAESARGALGAVAPGRLGLAQILLAHVRPLTNRVRRGEGQLFAINLSLIVASGSPVGTGLLQAVFSVALLAVLYLVNDVLDAPGDVHDPGKDQTFVEMLLQHRLWFVGLLAVEHLALSLLAWFMFGWKSGAAAASVLAVNAVYSYHLKGTAFVDAPAVALWGLLYALVIESTLPFHIYACVGFMTMVAHVFQIMRDRDVDARTAVRTSAVAYAWLPTVQMAAACTGIGACLVLDLGPWSAVSAAVPWLLYRGLRSNQTAWMAAKGYFAVVWLMLLVAVQRG